MFCFRFQSVFSFFALSVSRQTCCPCSRGPSSPIGVNQVFARKILGCGGHSCPEYFYSTDSNKCTHRDKNLAKMASHCYSQDKVIKYGKVVISIQTKTGNTNTQELYSLVLPGIPAINRRAMVDSRQ